MKQMIKWAFNLMVNISEFMVVTETVEKRSDLTQMFFELRNAKKKKQKRNHTSVET